MSSIGPTSHESPPSPEQHGLKHLDEEGLFRTILDSGPEWSEEERGMVVGAYNLGRAVHKDDRHRDKPYVYHLLRNTARISKYLHINDPEILAGSILHDSVEDHPDEIIAYSMFGTTEPPAGVSLPQDPVFKQQIALKHIEVLFTPRVARMVAGMTNPPVDDSSPKMPYAEKIQAYVSHVKKEIENPDVAIGKFSDAIGDNGGGINHGDNDDPTKKLHFMNKYSKLVPIFAERFAEQDIQEMLDPVARINVEHMLALADERLTIRTTPGQVGSIAVNN